ncbi:unnamed protein product, partial [Discosporangium mesarthrocarpum]
QPCCVCHCHSVNFQDQRANKAQRQHPPLPRASSPKYPPPPPPPPPLEPSPEGRGTAVQRQKRAPEAGSPLSREADSNSEMPSTHKLHYSHPTLSTAPTLLPTREDPTEKYFPTGSPPPAPAPAPVPGPDVVATVAPSTPPQNQPQHLTLSPALSLTASDNSITRVFVNPGRDASPLSRLRLHSAEGRCRTPCMAELTGSRSVQSGGGIGATGDYGRTADSCTSNRGVGEETRGLDSPASLPLAPTTHLSKVGRRRSESGLSFTSAARSALLINTPPSAGVTSAGATAAVTAAAAAKGINLDLEQGHVPAPPSAVAPCSPGSYPGSQDPCPGTQGSCPGEGKSSTRGDSWSNTPAPAPHTPNNLKTRSHPREKSHSGPLHGGNGVGQGQGQWHALPRISTGLGKARVVRRRARSRGLSDGDAGMQMTGGTVVDSPDNGGISSGCRDSRGGSGGRGRPVTRQRMKSHTGG